MGQFLLVFVCLATFVLQAFAPYFVARLMEKDDAAKEKARPVQFSLRDLMAAIALVAIGIALGLGVLRNPFNIVSPFAWLASGAAIGAGLFLPIRAPILGAMLGAFIQLCSGWVMLLAQVD